MSDTLPVVEIFGPTVQGEGIDQGKQCHFVRFGGCDFKCDWCDTPHAVLPDQVRKAERMSADAIYDKLTGLKGAPTWIVLSGGNPVLHDLSGVVEALGHRWMLAVETQGTLYKPWVENIDRLCVSPKPPSSGMEFNLEQFERYYNLITSMAHGWGFIKVVVFDDADLYWAGDLLHQFPGAPFYLSAGNDAGKTVGNPGRVDFRTVEHVREDLLNKSRWLVEKTVDDPMFSDVIVQSQYHVLMWGNVQGR